MLRNPCRRQDAALVELGKQLRGLTSLALKIIAVQPVSANGRHTSGAGALPHPCAGGQPKKGAAIPRCIEPIALMVQLEGSGPLLPS